MEEKIAPSIKNTKSNAIFAEMLEPVEAAADLPKEQCAWVCPHCEKGLPKLKRYHKEISIKWHMANEHPRKSQSLTKIYHKRRQVFKNAYKKNYNEKTKDHKAELAKKATENYQKRLQGQNHEIEILDIKMTQFWGKEPRRGALKLCRKCRSNAKSLVKKPRQCIGTCKKKW